MNSDPPAAVELSPREKGFVRRIMQKYPGGRHQGKDLYRSLAIMTLLIVVGHVLEQVLPTRWLALAIILPPALFMFTRYRKFSIFRSCVLSKVAGRLAQYEDLTPPRGTADPHARRVAPDGGSSAPNAAKPGRDSCGTASA